MQMEPGLPDERRRDVPEANTCVGASSLDRKLLCAPVGEARREESDLVKYAVGTTISVLRGKWKALIIETLQKEPLRFSVLLRRIPKASRKVLTDQLRDLQRAKIVSRTVLAKKSQRVEYSLTSYGQTLVPVLAVLARWGELHLKALDECLSFVGPEAYNPKTSIISRAVSDPGKFR